MRSKQTQLADEREALLNEFRDLDRTAKRILRRAQPSDERKDLELFLKNVLFFIKRVFMLIMVLC